MTAPRRLPTPSELKWHQRRQAFLADIAEKAAALALSKLEASRAPIVDERPPSSIEQPLPVSYDTKPAIPARPENPFWFSLVELGQNPVTIRRIQEMVRDEFNLRAGDLASSRRNEPIVTIRQGAMWLCKELIPERSYPEIGRRFGGRDHTTVLHAVRVAPRKLAENEEVRTGIMKIFAALAEMSAQATELKRVADEVAQFEGQADGQ